MKSWYVMTKFETIEKIIADNGGIAKTASFRQAGLSNYDVANLCNEGRIQRVRHGYYQLADPDSPSEAQLLATLLPEGIVCVESALFHYGYSDFTPREWSVAVPRAISRTRLKSDPVPLKVYYVQDKWLSLGKTAADFGGTPLAIYDRERTICDCFKYRSRLDSELFNKALNAYAADGKKNLGNLSKYAGEMKVYKKLMELMEVLLNG